MEISVIICTHNPRAAYLHRVLDTLKAQTLPMEQWELLLIDNASVEQLAPVWDLSWHPHARHIREDELGLTPARLRGIRETSTELILFIDDDNRPDLDYLAQLLVLTNAYPWLGCFGAGALVPEFEEPPAPELSAYCHHLAIRTVRAPQWSNIPDGHCTPWGAGLAVRRAVAQKYAELTEICPIRSQLDRKGSQLTSGGDEEFSWASSAIGYGVGIFPALKITHLIDRRRVQIEYLEKIEEGNAFSHALMRHIHKVEQWLPSRNPSIERVAKEFAKTTFNKLVALTSREPAKRKALLVACRMRAARLRGLQHAATFIADGSLPTPGVQVDAASLTLKTTTVPTTD